MHGLTTGQLADLFAPWGRPTVVLPDHTPSVTHTPPPDTPAQPQCCTNTAPKTTVVPPVAKDAATPGGASASAASSVDREHEPGPSLPEAPEGASTTPTTSTASAASAAEISTATTAPAEGDHNPSKPAPHTDSDGGGPAAPLRCFHAFLEFCGEEQAAAAAAAVPKAGPWAAAGGRKVVVTFADLRRDKVGRGWRGTGVGWGEEWAWPGVLGCS